MIDKPEYDFNEGGCYPSIDEYDELAKRLEKHVTFVKVTGFNPDFSLLYNTVARQNTSKIDLTMVIEILKLCNDVPYFVTEKIDCE